MTAIATSLTGPVAYAIGLIGIAIAGGAMLWGGELTEFGTAGLHDRSGRIRARLRRTDVVERVRRNGGGDLNHEHGRQSQRNSRFTSPETARIFCSAGTANSCW